MPGDNKQNFTWADRNPELATGVRALAAGGSVAAISAIISDILEARRQRAESAKRKNKGISEDTVVLHVRKPESEKAAQACEGSCECNPAECDGEKVVGNECKVVPKVEPATEEREIAYQGQGNQPRAKDGKYSTLGKVAQSKANSNLVSWRDFFNLLDRGEAPQSNYSWGQTLGKGIQIASVPVFGTLGYYAVSSLHKKLEENRLKKQLAAAQQEYIDLLDGKKVKSAEAFSRMFLFDDKTFEKQAAGVFDRVGSAIDSAGNFLDSANATSKHLTAGMIAAAILTGGASAWLTHKVLANKFDKKDEEEEPNKVTKVMFKEFSDKSDPGFTMPKLMFKSAESEYEITPEQFICTIEVLRDCIRDSDPSEKTAAFGIGTVMNNVVPWDDVLRSYATGKGELPAGWTKDVMLKMMRENPDGWFNALGKKENADIRDALVDKYMNNSSGFLGGLSNIPVLGDIMKFFARGFMNTKWGRRMMARRALMQTGMSEEQAGKYMEGANFDENGWSRPAAKPVAKRPVAKKPVVKKPVVRAPAPPPAATKTPVQSPATAVKPAVVPVQTPPPAAKPIPGAH